MSEADARIAERRIGGSQIWFLLRSVATHQLDYFFELTFNKPPFRGNAYTDIGKESEEEFAMMWADVPGVRFNANTSVLGVTPEDDVCGTTEQLCFAVTPDVWMPGYIVEIKTTCPLSVDYPTRAPKIEHKAQLLCYMACTNSTHGTLFNAHWYKDGDLWKVRSKNFHYYIEADELAKFSRDLLSFIRRVFQQPKRLREMKPQAEELMKYIKNVKLDSNPRLDYHFIGSFDDSTYLGSLLASVSHD